MSENRENPVSDSNSHKPLNCHSHKLMNKLIWYFIYAAHWLCLLIRKIGHFAFQEKRLSWLFAISFLFLFQFFFLLATITYESFKPTFAIILETQFRASQLRACESAQQCVTMIYAENSHHRISTGYLNWWLHLCILCARSKSNLAGADLYIRITLGRMSSSSGKFEKVFPKKESFLHQLLL